MNVIDVFKMAMGSLAANKLRSSLTMVAIIVGVFAVIGSSTAVSVLDRYFKDTLTILGGNVITIQKFPAVRMGGDNSDIAKRKNITFTQFETLRDRANLARAVSPIATFAFNKVVYNENETEPNVPLRGSNEYWTANNAYTVADGRDFNLEDVTYARSVAIIGEDIRKELFANENAIGKKIRIEGQAYSIIGVLESKGSIFGQSKDRIVVAPYTRLLQLYGGADLRSIGIQVQAPDMRSVPATMDELIGNFRTIRKVPPGADNDFEVVTNNSLSSVFDTFTGVLNILGVIVGGIALLGAGIGVMNIMLVSVTERTREIGVRKSVGATRKAIRQQFLIEAIFICQIGGVIGIILGIIGGNALAVLMEASIVIPWTSAVFGVVMMTAIGLVFGVYPAAKAARLDPIESLRYE